MSIISKAEHYTQLYGNTLSYKVSHAADYTVPITNLRYWSTDIYSTQCFNNFIRFSLKGDIKKESYPRQEVVVPGDLADLVDWKL